MAQSFGPSQVLRLLGSQTEKAAAAATLQDGCRTLLNTATEALRGAVRDNDLIYHDAVPDAAALPRIPRVDATRLLSFADICGGGGDAADREIARIVGPDLFARIVPLSVHTSASMYSEEKAGVVRGVSRLIDAADQVCVCLFHLCAYLTRVVGAGCDAGEYECIWDACKVAKEWRRCR